MTIKVFDRTAEALAKSLDLHSQKLNIVTANIANAETPGYQAQTIDFEQSLARAINLDDAPMERTDPDHMSAGGEVNAVRAEIYNTINNIVREDGNTVDRDAEMVTLSETQLMYSSAAELIKKKLGMLKYSINEGGSH